MEITDFCDYKLGLALKACGFDEPCRAHYSNDYINDDPEDLSREVKFHYDWTSPYNYNRVVGNTSAPTLAHAQKWLREKKGIVVSVHPEGKFLKDERTYKHTGWGYSIIRINKNSIMAPGPIGHILMAKYECALSAGIAAALELIKKGE